MYYKIIKKRISKYNMEILRNIELISFIPPSFINSYKKFLKNNLNNEKLDEILPHIFITNNIDESLHNKINYYLPSKKITYNNFIISIRNIFINYENKNINLIRKDFVTKALISYSKT